MRKIAAVATQISSVWSSQQIDHLVDASDVS